MADTGWVSPTATGDDYNNWTNPSYAYSDDSNRATTPNVLFIYDFVGQVSFDGGVTYPSVSDCNSFTVPSGSGSEAYASSGGATDKWYGSPIDNDMSNSNFRIRFSRSNSLSELIDSESQDYYNFSFSIPSGSTIDGIECRIKCYYAGEPLSFNYYINHVQVKVYYTESEESYASPFPAFRA